MSKEEKIIRKSYRAETGESPNKATWMPADYTNSYVEWLEARIEQILSQLEAEDYAVHKRIIKNKK